MTDIPGYALLGRVNTPADLRALAVGELPALAVEMRRHLIETLGRIGGHFAANLGTVELTLALHRAFDTPHDRLIWDVGHQAYPHKMLTGRRAQLETIRRKDGLAPFLQRSESEYDVFGAGHSSTSISAAAGMAAAARLKGEKRRVVAIIGDGGMSAGMAFEALNHIGHLGLDVLVIYNDNDMSISENVGALRDYSARLMKKLGLAAPHHARTPRETGSEGEDNFAHLERPGSLFETLGFGYHGPVDGHDLGALLPTLERLKDARGPQLLHVITVKGKGFEPAEADPIKYHGVTQFDPVTGDFPSKKPGARHREVGAEERAAAVRARQALRGTRQGHGRAGHDLRGIRLQLRGPDRRPRPRFADSHTGEPAPAERPAVPARGHEEGLWLQARRG